jgi:hypothetical protein
MNRVPLPPLHPDRIQKAIRWFEMERGSFNAEDVSEFGAEYDTAIQALKTLDQFYKTCRLTPDRVDTVIAVRGFFDHLRDLTQKLR